LDYKICNKCKIELPATEEYFYKQLVRRKKKPDYYKLTSWCIECSKEATRKRNEKDPEKHRKASKNYRDQNSDKYNSVARTWREENQERKQQYQLEYQRNNPEKMAEYSRYRMMHKTHNISTKQWENCKKYFDNKCAYCGLPLEEHWVRYNGKLILGDFHKDHVDHEGSNDLSNCIPSCKSCNDRKWKFKLGEWYTPDNQIYAQEQYNKITKWLTEDYKLYIEQK
jgi:hypothetical protein